MRWPSSRSYGLPAENLRDRGEHLGLVELAFGEEGHERVHGDNGTDEFIARQAWLYVASLGAGYFISRGLAKSGSCEPYTPDATSQEQHGRLDAGVDR